MGLTIIRVQENEKGWLASNLQTMNRKIMRSKRGQLSFLQRLQRKREDHQNEKNQFIIIS